MSNEMTGGNSRYRRRSYRVQPIAFPGSSLSRHFGHDRHVLEPNLHKTISQLHQTQSPAVALGDRGLKLFDESAVSWNLVPGTTKFQNDIFRNKSRAISLQSRVALKKRRKGKIRLCRNNKNASVCVSTNVGACLLSAAVVKQF